MKYGFVIPSGAIEDIVDLTVEAERAGWDGAFTWDGMDIEMAGPMSDAWVALAAMALRTERVTIGAEGLWDAMQDPGRVRRRIVAGPPTG